MLQEPPASAYDLKFSLFGYHVRVFWAFWLMALLLGWNWSNGLNQAAAWLGADSPGAPVLLMIWIAAVFVSILVHELGHALAFSYYGTESHIVLYHFGGLAIPGSFGQWNAARRRSLGPKENIVISAAGPGLQLLLGGLVWAIGWAAGVRMDLLGLSIGPTEEYPGSMAVYALFGALLWPSVFWALINLVPIYPLDGGQILRSALRLTNVARPDYVSVMVSVACGGLLGVFFLTRGNTIAGIMFIMLAANNFQSMQYGGGY